MRLCKNCKTEINDSCNFCPNCGEKVEREISPVVSQDVERIKALIPVLKNMMSGTSEENMELVQALAEQRKMLDDTIKELTELKEEIKKSANSVPANFMPYGQPYGPMMPYPPYGAYPYPSYVQQGGYPPYGAYPYPPYPAQAPKNESAPVEPIKEKEQEQEEAISQEPIQVVSDNYFVQEDQEVSIIETEEEREPVYEKKKGKLLVRVLSFIMILLSLGAIVAPFMLAMIQIPGTNYVFGGKDVLDAVIYNFTLRGTEINSVFVGFIIDGVLRSSEVKLHIAWWAYAVSLVLVVILLVIDAIIGFVRVASGRTKGRFYWLSFVSLILCAINIVGLNILMTGSGNFLKLLAMGSYVFVGAIVLRFILAFFVRNTKKESPNYQSKKERKLAKKSEKKARKLEKLAR